MGPAPEEDVYLERLDLSGCGKSREQTMIVHAGLLL